MATTYFTEDHEWLRVENGVATIGITDYAAEVPVVYDRVLPDLFKENSGVVANGRLNEQGVFVADEVLAKHDENYMPPAVQESLRRGESRLDNAPTAPN